jgi:hypothetical protein
MIGTDYGHHDPSIFIASAAQRQADFACRGEKIFETSASLWTGVRRIRPEWKIISGEKFTLSEALFAGISCFESFIARRSSNHRSSRRQNQVFLAFADWVR